MRLCATAAARESTGGWFVTNVTSLADAELVAPPKSSRVSPPSARVRDKPPLRDSAGFASFRAFDAFGA